MRNIIAVFMHSTGVIMRKIEQIYTQCYENILNEQHSYIRLRKTLGYRYFSALDEAKDLSLTNQRL